MFRDWQFAQKQLSLTQANAVLGQGQLSLAKFLWIIDEACDPKLDIHDVPMFFKRMLERVDWQRDLHFQTNTTIDTLDYSGSGVNQGSKVVIAARGPVVRELTTEIPGDLSLPPGFENPRVAMPGILVVQGPEFQSVPSAAEDFCTNFEVDSSINRFPLLESIKVQKSLLQPEGQS